MKTRQILFRSAIAARAKLYLWYCEFIGSCTMKANWHAALHFPRLQCQPIVT